MLNTEYIKKLIPGIITRVALYYPFNYIESISFSASNKLIASCFWKIPNDKNIALHTLKIGSNSFPGCYIYKDAISMDATDVEITGMDSDGKNFIVSLPLTYFIELRKAS